VNLRQKLWAIDLPDDLTGKSVLEIGPADGFFCFECERRGAQRVVGLDYIPSKGFVLAKEILASSARLIPGDVACLTPGMVGGQYDLTIFLSVLHHISDHLGVLKRLRRVTREQLILETPIHPGRTGPEALLAVPEAQKLRLAPNYYADDHVDLTGATSERSYERPYYLANSAYVLRMLELAGFSHSRLIRKYELERNGGSDLRAVFHAEP
jgi:SAM-dependent methyltransferase